jgi:urease accessory protein
MHRLAARLAPTLAALLVPGVAFAHPGLDHTHGFAAGFVHPVSGIDHVLAMVAVGIFAARLGGRALWLVPASFVGMMALGGALGMTGVAVPFVEAGIGASIVVLGLAIAMRWALPTAIAMGLVGAFAIFHGHAHGAEMPETAGVAFYAVGFVVATALLHAAGIGLGVGASRMFARHGDRMVQAVGGLMALAGVGVLAGAF